MLRLELLRVPLDRRLSARVYRLSADLASLQVLDVQIDVFAVEDGDLVHDFDGLGVAPAAHEVFGGFVEGEDEETDEPEDEHEHAHDDDCKSLVKVIVSTLRNHKIAHCSSAIPCYQIGGRTWRSHRTKGWEGEPKR